MISQLLNPDRTVELFLLDHVEQKAISGVQILDTAGDRIFWSQGLYRLFGLQSSTNEPSAELFDSLLHPEDYLKAQISSIYAQPKGRPRQKQEFRIVRPDRTVRWISCSTEVLVDDSGAPKTFISVFFDMTEQRALAEQTRLDEEHRSLLFSVLNAVTWVVGADGVKPDVSSWRAKTGQSARDAQGAGWLGAIHPDDRDRVNSVLRNAFQYREEYNVIYRLRASSGEFRTSIARMTPVFDRSGRIIEWHGALIDIEDFKNSDPLLSLSHPDRLVKSPTGGHIRAARGAINWSVKDLASAASLTPAIIRSIEEAPPGSVPQERVDVVIAALRAQGVDFCLQSDGRIAIVFD